jgi:anthranilate synthase component II
MILLIDNYDSFVHNLARYFERLGHQTRVVRNDALAADDVRQAAPDALVLSPGPCTPTEAGCSLEIVRRFHDQVPMLGICLGHQTIAAAFGAAVVRAPEPVHGRASAIFHDSTGVFVGQPNPIDACRYHSLVVREQEMPECLRVNARTGDGIVMAFEHRRLPIVGLQFHPESILTPQGYALLAAFLRRCNLPVAQPLPAWSSERAIQPTSDKPLPTGPVTF